MAVAPAETPVTPTPTPASVTNPGSSPEATSSPPDDAAVQSAFDADEDSGQMDDFGLDFLKGAGDPAAGDRDASFGGADDGDTPQTPAAPAAPTVTPPPSAAPVAPVAQPTPTTPAQPAAQPPAAPAPVVPTAAPTVATPPAQPQAAAPAAPAQPAPAAQPAAPSEQDAVAQYRSWRENTIKTLSETDFAIDDKTAEEIEANPRALSRLAANVYLSAVENSVAAVTEQLNQTLAQRIEMVLENRTTGQKNVDDFYGAWPALKAHENIIGPMAVTFRQLQPNLSRDDFIKQFGNYAHLTLNIPIQAPAAAPAAPTPKPIAPHMPIGGGAPRGGQPAAAAPANVFAALAGNRGEITPDFGEDPDDA